MNQPKPKKGAGFIDTLKDQPVYLFHIRNMTTYIVSTDIHFENADDMYEANPIDLRQLYLSRVSSINSKPKKITEQQKSDTHAMNEFFDKVGLKIPYNCMECGKPLYASTKFAKRCVSAHILRKSDFPTIAQNEHNLIFLGCSLLGVCSCHNSYDDLGAEHRSKMKIYDLIIERFLKHLKPLLNDREIIKACTYLYIHFE